jgi:hypothetical protein
VFRKGPKEPEIVQTPAPTLPDSANREAIVTVSTVFPKFLAAVARVERPVLLDLGPAVGSNVDFFGGRFACKLYIENLFLDIEAASRSGSHDALEAALLGRLDQGPDSVDGILCWDLFDFLDRPLVTAVAARLSTLLRQGGAVYGFFGTTPIELKQYTRYVIDRDDRFCLRREPASPISRDVLMTRDINKMFDQLTVTDSVLLKTSTRETLFRRLD